MINVICTSNFDEMDSIQQSILDLGHKFKHKPIIKIDNITLSMESLIKIEKSNICIFQSKNTMNQLKSHQDLFNKSKTYYAVGVFTARSVETSINVNCKYPKKNFSSRDLVEEYKLDRLRNKRIVILKGKGGLSTIKESLEEKNVVDEILVYRRSIDIEIIDSKDFESNPINVVISMSQEALKLLCDNFHQIINNRNTVLIIPNERFVSKEISIFNKIFVLKSSEYKKEILNILKKIDNG